jgi:release factor glutamine methyltransferase
MTTDAPAAATASYAALVRDAAATLERRRGATDDWIVDAEVIARAILGWDAATWLTRQRERATTDFAEAFGAAIARRLAAEPVAYITGRREFYGRAFAVSPDVLIPRPETELVVDEALAAIAERRNAAADRPLRVADVGTGSGCLAVTLAAECPDITVVGTDISPGALSVASTNASRLGVSARITFRLASLLSGINTAFDVIASNPPYVARRDAASLFPDVRDYEPDPALFGGDDGLEVIRDLVPSAAEALLEGGWFLMEIGAGQAAAVTALIEATDGLELIHVGADLAGIPRVVVARRLASV